MATPAPPAPFSPHDAYIDRVVLALSSAGIKPGPWHTDDDRPDWWATQGTPRVLSAVLEWPADHPAAANTPGGLALLWDHLAEHWRWSPVAAVALAERDPEFVTYLGRYADPSAVVVTVRALLAGQPVPEGVAPEWSGAEQVRAGVAAWVAAEGGER